MRRADKEIASIEEIESIIGRSQVCRLGLCMDNEPYVVPLCFGYIDGTVYIHCAREGTKLDIVRANNAVCVEFETDLELVQAKEACGWGMRYCSVIGFGHAFIVDDIELKRKACDAIMQHYSSSQYNYKDEALDQITIIKIEIDRMTGKRSGY